MDEHWIGVRAFAALWLAAAGCGAEARRAEEFNEEKADMLCDIDAACTPDDSGTGEPPPDCTPHDFDPDTCNTIDEEQASECLTALEERLKAAENGECEAELEPEVCRTVVSRRNRKECQGYGGRPIRIEGQALLPRVSRTAARPIDTEHEIAGARWLEMARLEHASVAAFGRVAAQLMALGAPLDLVEACHRAALDEVRHARLACSVTDELLGGTTTILSLDLPPTPSATLWEVARDALLEGCIGEGIAAAEAKVAAGHARADIAEVLQGIAADEARHAALAWKTLRWALSQDPTLVPRLDRVLRDRMAELSADDRRGCPELGVLSGSQLATVERDVLTSIVAPILGTLLRQSSSPLRTPSVS